MSSRLRIGLVGFGGIANLHTRYLEAGEIPDAGVTAVCDTDPKRLDAAKERFGDRAQYFDSHQAMFKARACDAAIICTPHYDHPPIAIDGLQSGHHMLSEKPAGVYTKQVRELNRVAEASDKVFGIMFNQRTIAAHQAMRDLVQSGELGSIIRTQYTVTHWIRTQAYYDRGGWRGTWSGEGGGVLLNQSPHQIDLWQWICGMPSRVRAFCRFGAYHNMETEDDVTAYVEYPNGGTGLYITSTAESPGVNRLEISGDNGRAVLEGGKITLYRNDRAVSDTIANDNRTMPSWSGWTCEREPKGGDQHKGITRNWVETIRGNATLLAPGVEGIHMVEIANAMLMSAWTGETVELPIDDERYYALLQEKVRSSTFVKQSTNEVENFAGTT